MACPASSLSSAATTRRVLRRTDIYLLPFLALLFLLNSLDRSNIGNAETAGFTKHSGLEESDLNDAVAGFFIAFVALQPLGAALGKRVGVGRWVGGVMVGWGVLTMLTAFVRTRGELILLRVCIGALEAGFYPATVFYLSLFYTRYEFAQRLGIFYGQYAVAGAFGGLVSYIVFSIFPSDPAGDSGELTKSSGWHSYQILFVMEGILTIVVAITTLFWLPTGPGTAWWLTPSERAFAQRRVMHDRMLDTTDNEAGESHYDSDTDDLDENSDEDGGELSESADLEASSSPTLHHRAHRRTPPIDSTSRPLLVRPSHRANPASLRAGGEAQLTRLDVFTAFTDTKIWFLLLLNILSSIPATAFSIFLPLVLAGLGHSPLAANALTIPPFLLGATVLWVITYLSDLHRVRIPFILLGLGINTLGLLAAVFLPEASYTARYFALCILLAGSYIASPLTIAWISGNIQPPGKRAIVLGINGWGNLAGVIAGWLFEPRWAPTYRVPLAVTLICVGVSTAGYAVFWTWLERENRFRAKMAGEGKVQEEDEVAGVVRAWAWGLVGGGKAEWRVVGEERWGVRYGI